MRVSPFLFLIVLAGCGGDPAPQGEVHAGPPPAPVGMAAPIKRDVPVLRELTGRIEAVHLVDLKPRVGGLIEQVLVADGAEVKAGQVLLILDEKPLLTDLAQAEAQVVRAEAHLAQAQREVERNRTLVGEKVVSQQLFDDAESGRLAAAADVAAATAARDSAKLDLDYAKVVSPIDGRIGKVLVTAGNLVQGGGPVPPTLLATIVSIDPVYVAFDLDETAWNRIGLRLREAAAGGTAVPVQVGISGEEGFPHPGEVAFADNQIDTASGAIRLRARVANADRRLVPGAFARVKIETDAPRPVLLIHEESILSQLATKYVLVVGEGGSTTFRPVQLGEHVGRLRVVTGGLGPDEQIVVTNLAKVLYPGMPVLPKPVSMETLTDPTASAPAATP